MRCVLLAIALISLACAGCDDSPDIPVGPQSGAGNASPRQMTYTIEDVVGKYHGAVTVTGPGSNEAQLRALTSGWTLELKSDGKFDMKQTVPMTGTYTVDKDMLLLTVEEQSGKPIREAIAAAEKQGVKPEQIEAMQVWQFKIIDGGRNLLKIEGSTVELGGFRFERD